MSIIEVIGVCVAAVLYGLCIFAFGIQVVASLTARGMHSAASAAAGIPTARTVRR